MADPLSITASVIAIAGSAFKSAKALIDLITSFKNAPALVQEVEKDLGILLSLLTALARALQGVPNAQLLENQRACFESLEPALNACKEKCDGVTAKLADLTFHTKGEKVDWRDHIRVHFNEKDFALLRSQLESYKQTVDIAIGVATLRPASQDHDALQSLETKISTSINNFSGQIMGLEAALQSLTIAESVVSSQDIDNVARLLNEQGQALKLCLKSCTGGLSEFTSVTGIYVKYAKTFDSAKQVIGTMGDVTGESLSTRVEYAEARDQSRQFVGTMSGDVAKSFWE